MKESDSIRQKILVEGTIDHLFKSFNLNDDGKNLDLFAKNINDGAIPIIVSNHQSLIDGIVVANIVNEINKRVDLNTINGFYLPYAVTLSTGDQNPKLVKYFSEVEKRCSQENLFLIPVVRKKDSQKYGIDEKNPLYLNSRKSLRKILNLAKDKYGLAIFPEGATQGGRLDKLGKFFGLFPSDPDNAIDSLIPRFIDEKKDFCILPIGINGSCRIFSPDSYEFNLSRTKTEVNIGDILKPSFFNFNEKSSDSVLKKIANDLLNPEYVGVTFKKTSRTNLI